LQAGEKRGDFIARCATLVLPAVAVLTVGYGVLVPGKPRPVRAARIRGGPTEGASSLSFRIEVVERARDAERGVPGARIGIEATFASGKALSWRGALDDEGAADVKLPVDTRVTGPVRMRVTSMDTASAGGSVVLLDGVVNLTADRWSAGAHRAGGWVEGRSGAALAVRVASGRGVFAVPFRDPLIVAVREGNKELSGAHVRASSEGADVDPAEVVTDSQGRGMLFVRPREHAISVVVRARSPSGTEGELEAALAVVPGAMHASMIRPSGGRPSDVNVKVESPIVRERAYVTIVGEHERFLGRAVTLVPDERGGAVGMFAIDDELAPRITSEPSWAVVSSEPDQRSGAVVGWPLVTGKIDEPRRTFDVPDALLADGIAAAERRERERVGRVRLWAAFVAVTALALTGALVVLRARRAERALEAHLDESLDQETTSLLVDTGSGRSWIVVAICCVALGALLVAVFALWR